jgi:dihydroxyacid dehydratase/phosphogluconate dehydratase
VLKGNLFDFAIMKTSVISPAFRERYLSQPGQIGRHLRGKAVVFDGSDDYHHRINDPALNIDENTILVIRGAGPIGWPGSAEVVNMQPPDAPAEEGHHEPADAWATAASRAPPTAPRSSTPRPKAPSAAACRGCAPAT